MYVLVTTRNEKTEPSSSGTTPLFTFMTNKTSSANLLDHTNLELIFSKTGRTPPPTERV